MALLTVQTDTGIIQSSQTFFDRVSGGRIAIGDVMYLFHPTTGLTPIRRMKQWNRTQTALSCYIMENYTSVPPHTAVSCTELSSVRINGIPCTISETSIFGESKRVLQWTPPGVNLAKPVEEKEEKEEKNEITRKAEEDRRSRKASKRKSTTDEKQEEEAKRTRTIPRAEKRKNKKTAK
jgi:hypothetical protein